MEKDTTNPNEMQRPKDPEYEILDIDPLKMIRPLALIKGKSYAVVWVKTQKTDFEECGKDGKIIKYDPPKITIFDQVMIVREDGKKCGVSSTNKEFGFEVGLSEKPDANCILSGNGVSRFLNGECPHPIVVFERLVQIIDKFIDFYRSLAVQGTMCEFVACWILSTWFIEAFNVTGYLWINGERGSGKTDLLSLLSGLTYLGQFISHSGTFSSLRDMANLGATLCYDDAESITYQTEKDQDKRNLLLAGNHRGVHVPVKIPGPDKTWVIRYVNAFCPKAFSAIRLPDSVLASRSISIPLVRSSDTARVDIDPMDYEEWPCDRRILLDDLWSLALINLSQVSYWDKWVGMNAKLHGRNLQPWKSVLAVAKWLDENGMQGIYQRMEDLSISYQNQRSILDIPDLTLATLQGLVVCAISAIKADNAIKKKGYCEIRTADLVEVIKNIANEEELDLDPEKIQSRQVGRVLGRLRFEQIARSGGTGPRKWKIDIRYLVQQAQSYNIPLPEVMFGNEEIPPGSLQGNGTDGTNGSNGTNFALFNSEGAVSQLEPMHLCPNCKATNYFQRPDGGWVCKVCHP
jgi:hypothetical protein